MLKVAVIGMGSIGSTHHAPIYNASPLCELVAVCDIIEERADKAAAKYGVPAYYSVEDMLANEELDAVSITTAGMENGGDHYTPTMQCLNAGLHVLGEKPISNDIDPGAGDGGQGRRTGPLLRHQPQPPLRAAGGQGQGMGRRGQDRRTAADQHDHVDRQPQTRPRPGSTCARCTPTRSTSCATSAAT